VAASLDGVGEDAKLLFEAVFDLVAMAMAWRSLEAEVMRKKSERPESMGSSSRMRVSRPFLSSQTAAAAWT